MINKIEKICVLITVFLIPFYIFRFNFLGIPSNIFELMVAVSVAITAYNKFTKTYNLDFSFRWGRIWPYLFILTALFGVLIADDKATALGILKGWFIIPVALYWLILNNFKSKELPQISLSLFLSVIIISVWAILQRSGLITTLFYQANDANFNQYLAPTNFRVFGPFESPNYLAMFLAPALTLSLPSLLLLRKTVGKIFLVLLFILPLLAIYFSASRGGLIALAVVLVVALLLFSVKSYLGRVGRIEAKLILGLSYSVKALLTLGFVGVLAKIMMGSPFSRPVLGTDQSRTEIYKQSLLMLKENYLTGIGLGGFRDKIEVATENMVSFRQFLLPYALHPHNLYLALWLNLGLAGIIIFTIILYRFAKDVRKISGLMRLGLILAMLAILTHGIVDTTYFKNDLSAIFFLTIALSQVAGRENEKA